MGEGNFALFISHIPMLIKSNTLKNCPYNTYGQLQNWHIVGHNISLYINLNRTRLDEDLKRLKDDQTQKWDITEKEYDNIFSVVDCAICGSLPV